MSPDPISLQMYTKPTDSPFYRLFQCGRENWNRWAAEGLSNNEKRRFATKFTDVAPLTPAEKETLARRIGLLELPDPAEATFERVRFVSRIDFTGIVFANVSFRECRFEEDVYFSDAEFFGSPNFIKGEFAKRVRFDRSRFFGSPSFDEVQFHQGCAFPGASFDDFVDFNGSAFLASSDFSAVAFNAGSNFEKASFKKVSTFDDAIFKHDSSFEYCSFVKSRFRRVKFESDVRFDGVEFQGETQFNKATFAGRALFPGCNFKNILIFNDSKFEDEINFSNSKFFDAPYFHRSELHQDISWHNCSFELSRDSSDDSKSKAIWARRRSAWRVLRQAMSRNQDFEEELRFFALEMEARSHVEPGPRSTAIKLYGHIAGYGRSVFRPLLALSAVTVAFFLCYALILSDFSCVTKAFECNIDSDALIEVVRRTIEGTIPVISSQFVASEQYRVSLSGGVALAIYSANLTHKVISTALIFLIVLGIRNLFRLK